MGRVAEEYAWCFAWYCEVSGGSLTACLGGVFGCYVWLYMVCCVALPVVGIVDGKQ